MSIGVIVITHTAKKHLRKCLPVFLESSLRPRVLVVNSSSGDGTVELAQELGAETLVVPRREFNHGATRERARQFLGTDVVVMVTPDAHATDPRFLEKLVAPILNGSADVAYARQLPHAGADIFESFPRAYNYPTQSNLRSLADVPKWGVYSFFCSNSCAAWRTSALDAVGGFIPVLTNEDYFAVARILKNRGKIAYVAEAEIHHSHRYTLRQEFSRYFDTGLVRAEQPWVNEIVGAAEARGMDFAKAFFRELGRTQPWLVPYAVVQTGCKWLGYRVGFWSLRAPLWWKKWISSQDFYWTSAFVSGPNR